MVTQYLTYTLERMNKKQEVLQELERTQESYNSQADEAIAKQEKRIKDLEEKSKFLNDNCLSLEFLARHLGLNKIVEEIGKKTDRSFAKSDFSYNKEE